MLKDKKNTLSLILFFSLVFICLCFLFLSSMPFAQEEFVYDSKGRRDPFIALVTSDGRILKLDNLEGPKTLSLEGIMYDRYGISYAMVNGEIVKVSDEIAGYRVLAIEETRVVFIKDGETLTIELKKEEE